jgi:hypothetical protein
VVECANGSLCCNNDPQCCQDGQGTFLDENGKVVAARVAAPVTTYLPGEDTLERFPVNPSTSTTSSSTSSSTGSSTSSTSESESATASTPTTPSEPEGATSTPANAAPAPAPSSGSDGSDDSLGLKIGLGLGIPLAILMTACVVYFVLRRRLGPRGGHQPVPQNGVQQYQQYPHPSHPGSGSAAHLQAGYPYPPPAEAYPLGQGANELDGGQYGVPKPSELR